MNMMQGGAQPVVARFIDGRTIKGTTRDFGPNKPKFHLFPWGEETDKSLDIVIGSLKAVFFVKSYEGNSEHNEDNSFENAQGQGRKLVVHFKDGETIAGFTMGYNPSNQGFFLIPADAESNNARIYIVNAAVNKAVPFTGVAPMDKAASSS